jgi:hypothetical protein
MSSNIRMFMEHPIKVKGREETPASMLVTPGADVGLGDVAEVWVTQIIASDDPDTEFSILIDHVAGVLKNLKLVQERYRNTISQPV